MHDVVASGRAVDFVLAVMAVEACVLMLRRAPSGRGRRAIDLFCALAPGAFLLLALRASLTGLGWRWIAFFLIASFPFHLADLGRRRL